MTTYKVEYGSWGYELRRYEDEKITGAWVMSRYYAYKYRSMLLNGKTEIEIGLN